MSSVFKGLAVKSEHSSVSPNALKLPVSRTVQLKTLRVAQLGTTLYRRSVPPRRIPGRRCRLAAASRTTGIVASYIIFHLTRVTIFICIEFQDPSSKLSVELIQPFTNSVSLSWFLNSVLQFSHYFLHLLILFKNKHIVNK